MATRTKHSKARIVMVLQGPTNSLRGLIVALNDYILKYGNGVEPSYVEPIVLEPVAVRQRKPVTGKGDGNG